MLDEVGEELGKVRCEFFVIVVENHDQGGEKSHRCQLWKKVSLFGFNHNFFRFDVIRLKKAVAHIFCLDVTSVEPINITLVRRGLAIR